MDPTDLPRDELMALAEVTLKELNNPNAQVHFKFTCANCGERCIFDKPNTLYETGECCECGHTTTVNEGGFMLDVKL
jgi:hypothetical protein